MTHLAPRFFLRPVVAMFLAAALAFTPVAASPARAGNDDAAKVIGALIVLGLIGAAINHNSRTNTAIPNPLHLKNLPGSCLKTFDTRFGNESFFGKRCLRNNFQNWAGLPAQCALTIQTENWNGNQVQRHVYQPRCLRQEGYRIAWNS